jgi:hypothetical protein
MCARSRGSVSVSSVSPSARSARARRTGAPFNTGPKNTWILDGVGRATQLVDANTLMWEFFGQHTLPAGP